MSVMSCSYLLTKLNLLTVTVLLLLLVMCLCLIWSVYCQRITRQCGDVISCSFVMESISHVGCCECSCCAKESQ